MFTKSKLVVIALVAISMALCGAGYAYQIPYQNTNARYFYVFGKDGDVLMGAESGGKMEIFIDVPAAEPGDVTISVFDPNTGGKNDLKKPNNEWDTTCEFAVYGKELLDKKEFSADPQYDHQYYTFGPYSKDKGEKVGDHYRFRLVATGVSGDDQNLFKVRISPNSAESFSELITFRLLPVQGDKMYFYPGVAAGTKSVTVRNYDLDPNGGTSALSVNRISQHYPIMGSESGQWAETVVPIQTDTAGRLVYIITKATQRYANAGVKMTDDKGNVLPIYFRKGPEPVSERPAPVPVVVKKPELKCNQYTFDATSSYDIDKQKLTYLWNFGDGQTSTEPVVTHVYEKGGEYNVTLSVKDSSGLPCDSASTSQKVYVNTAPIAAFSCSESVCTGDTVTLNASATTDDTPEKLSYAWNFGDGAKGEGKTVTHTYAKGGQYNVTLMVNDNAGTICSTDSIQKAVRVNTAPVANAGKDVVMCLRSAQEQYNVAFDGTGSHDPDGDKLTYMWNFGDGATAEGAKVTHAYAKGGDYKATLTVSDGSGSACGTSTSMVNVNLNRAPIADAGDSKKACVGQSVSFDGSKSTVESGSAKYQWSFGDGETGTGATTTHVYQKGGAYSVVLTVDDGKGTPCSVSTDALQVNVNAAPVAALAGVKDICSGKQISFDASGSNDPDGDKLTYTWDFGDGTTETGGARMNHAYTKGGTYNVSVTVNDGKDSPCSSSTSSTRVKVNTPPVVNLTVVKACCVDMEQKFDASASSDADGDSLKYTWDFGDGTTAEGVKVSHTYAKPGTYKVLLKVDDGSGTECSLGYASEVINVNASPVAVIKVK